MAAPKKIDRVEVLARLEAAGRLGLRGRDLYHGIYGPPALPAPAVRLDRFGEAYRTAVRVARGCAYACRGVLAGLTVGGPVDGGHDTEG